MKLGVSSERVTIIIWKKTHTHKHNIQHFDRISDNTHMGTKLHINNWPFSRNSSEWCKRESSCREDWRLWPWLRANAWTTTARACRGRGISSCVRLRSWTRRCQTDNTWRCRGSWWDSTTTTNNNRDLLTIYPRRTTSPERWSTFPECSDNFVSGTDVVSVFWLP